MKTLSPWKNGAISGFAFFLTVTILSVGYATLSSSLSTADKVGTGSGLTANSWNKIVDSILELDGRTASISSSGGNIGIGTTNPTTKLDVNGVVKATNFSGLANSFVTITATSTVGNANANTWINDASCPAGFTIIFVSALRSTQFWGGGMTHWYAKCLINGNGIQASLYTNNGYTGHTFSCTGLCVKQ